MSGYGGFSRGGQRRWTPLGEYEANEHIAGLVTTGLTLSAYCKQKGVSRQALAEALKTHRPDLYDSLVQKSADPGKTGTKFEYSAKGMLERRGYFVVRQYASRSAFDLLAVGADKPTLMVQAKKDGKLYFEGWNALYDLAVEHGCWPVLVRRPPGETRGAQWFRLTGRKEKKGVRSDGLMEPFEPRHVTQASLFAA